jgi:hypothetical protein
MPILLGKCLRGGVLAAWGVLALPAGAQAQSAKPASAKTDPPPTLHIPHVSRTPKLEDFLNNTPREAEAVISEFRQRDPGDGVPASEPTTAYLSYDDKNFYVVFVCQDAPGKVRGRMAKREDIGSDDEVAVYLDTFHDRRHAFVFAVNPLGIQLDGLFTEGQGDDFSFDTLWHSEGRITPEGYVVWMEIPFKSLRFSDSPAQSWGIALDRIIIRTNEVDFWPTVTRRVQGIAQQFATLEGLENISPGRNDQVIPYGLFARARILDQTIPAFRETTDERGGVDAKFVFHDSMALDVTLNPDFSQVESDEPQVTIDQRFAVFFPEKRPFFLENAGFFQTPINLFFSRTIADPQFGVRLTGKAGKWAVGSLLMDDRAEGKSLPLTDPDQGDRAGIAVVRVQREFSSQSSVGLMVTSRDFAASSNRVFALDTRIKLAPNWVLTGQAVRSYTHNLDGSEMAGPAYFADLSFTGRHFTYDGNYIDISPDFRTDLGFVPRVDIRETNQFAGYFWRPEHSRVVAFGPVVSTLVNWNRQGQLQDWIASAGFQLILTGQTELQVSRGEAFELFEGIGFRKHSTAVQFDTEWLKWLDLSARYSQGTRENFFPASPLLPFLAGQESASLSFTIRPTPRFRYDQTYLYTRLGTIAGSTPLGTNAGASIFNNHILRSKVNYQFTKELSLRAIFDYNAVLANSDLIDLNTAFSSTLANTLVAPKHFTADFLLTYLLNPGTAVYVGYTDKYENLDLGTDPITGQPAIFATRAPNVSTGRQFFIKASYLFRF